MRSEACRSLLRCGRLTAAIAAAAGAAALAAPPAAHAAFGSCPVPESQPTTCETLTVPLDRSGNIPGSVHLFVERRPASQPSQGALVAIVGGPGQAASPVTDELQQVLAPALVHHDLIVVDLRGTGRSDRLSCPALDSAATSVQLDRATEDCAQKLGAARAFYTSRDDADDIEAVRQSLGLNKISLYGASYGTYTATTYARRYPSHVESLVLDSVINPDGRDPFDRSTYAAFPGMLRDNCSSGCRGVTRSPFVDFTRLAHRLARRPLRSVAFTFTGRRLRGLLRPADLFQALEAGDLDPLGRAATPAAIRAAVRGDGAPLARLLLHEQQALAGTAASFAAAPPPADSTAVFLATYCEEQPLPWSRTASLGERPGQANAAIGQVPASAFAPFARAVELGQGSSRPCLRWPDGSATSPVVGGPLPNVPALLLEGADDTRTPVADARAEASLLPQAQLIVVPHTGHSVIGTDLSSCSHDALVSFFAGQRASACVPQPGFAPFPLPPRSAARLHSAPGIGGKRGKTVTAVEDTLDDCVRESLSYLLTGAPIAEGGLRGGHFRGSVRGSVLTLRVTNVVYVPGVRVSGTGQVNLRAGVARGRVTVAGGAAAKGTLTFGPGTVSGRLDGRGVHGAGRASAAGFSQPAAAALLRLAELEALRAAASPR